MDANLSKRILERAYADNLPQDHILRKQAHEFQDAVDGFYSKEQTVSAKKMIGIWSRTRRMWSEYSGESLI